MSRTICLYLHVHQPFRVRQYSIFDAGADHNYWHETNYDTGSNNQRIIQKVADKSYRPTNDLLLNLLHEYPKFHLSLSITGTVLEQLAQWAPDVLDGFKKLVDTKRVEILAETYYHSLAFFYSRKEFERQVAQHHKKIHELFGVAPKVFRNTELAYNNDLAYWADQAGYKGIITEGWEPILGWKSPNFMYRPAYTSNIRLLLKNYKLSDDIAFRFSEHSWSEWPLTVDKYLHWLDMLPAGQQLINLFMDYETIGEHQWREDGIFDFMRHMPAEWMRRGNVFMTISQAIDTYQPADAIDFPRTVTWADSERDLSAWTGNAMQQHAIQSVYQLEHDVLAAKDPQLIEDWRRLQTSDHFYYMCTKWFLDGDVHAYFNPYGSPYDSFVYFSNVLRDMQQRVTLHKGART